MPKFLGMAVLAAAFALAACENQTQATNPEDRPATLAQIREIVSADNQSLLASIDGQLGEVRTEFQQADAGLDSRLDALESWRRRVERDSRMQVARVETHDRLVGRVDTAYAPPPPRMVVVDERCCFVAPPPPPPPPVYSEERCCIVAEAYPHHGHPGGPFDPPPGF